MAAAVLESLAAPRPRSVLRPAPVPQAAMAPVSAALLGRGMGVLPEYRGLRVSIRPPRVASAARVASLRSVRRAATVCEAQDTATEVPDVTKATWQSLVLDCGRTVLIEFWAPWCGPCRMIHPVIAKLSKAYEGKMDCFKLNTDDNPDIATQYGIRSIPTIMIFKNGEKKDAIIGAVPESTLVTCIEKFVER